MLRFLMAVVMLFFIGCDRSIKEVLTKLTPHKEYARGIEKADLANTVMGKEWIRAGKSVFDDSLAVTLPLSESGIFRKTEIRAHAFSFEMKAGQVLTIKTTIKAEDHGRLFIDLFVYGDKGWKNVAYADTTNSIQQEFDKNTQCLVRLQPELLIDAFYVINISTTPALANPVSGASNSSIGSVYGDTRDGGNRSHEGVDIFAPRGTPVIAPTDGYISRVGTNKLGGKVVWMRDNERSHSYYFAHLDSQLVSAGMRVKKFDTLATVGNTGNARTTPSHLHFGIYQRGNKDPLSFIRTVSGVDPEVLPDTGSWASYYTVSAVKANLRSGPGIKSPVTRQLEANTILKIIGQTKSWYRVLLPDDSQGYMSSTILAPAQEIEMLAITEKAYLLSEPKSGAIPLIPIEETTLTVLGSFKEFFHVRTAEGTVGWVNPG